MADKNNQEKKKKDTKAEGLEKKLEKAVEGEVTEDEPKKSASKVLQQLEVLAMRRGLSNDLDLGSLNDKQRDKLLDIAELNEKNAYDYHKTKLEKDTELEKERINASVITQRTTRVLSIGILLFFLIIFCIVLFIRPEYFVSLLTFVTGLAGGFGLSKLQIFLKDERKINRDDSQEKET